MVGLLTFIITILLATATFAQSAKTSIITTAAGSGLVGYGGDGAGALSATLDSPSCLAIDAGGNLYINDQRNSCVRKVNPAGFITTFAGKGVSGFSGDGGDAAAAKLNLNWGIAIDAGGNMYITDQVNFRVRKVNTAGVISTIAGTGSAGFYGDNGPATAAKFQSPLGIAVDNSGNIYVGDPNNFRIRKIAPSGIVTTIAGNGTYGSSGENVPATDAQLGYTWGLATDASGTLYICDGGNNTIRKVNTAGIITTIAGTGSEGYSGDGGPATSALLNHPLGIFVHGSGDIYIADCHNNAIRKIDVSGIITTIAGTGAKGYNGDNIPATAAELFHPVAVTMNKEDHIFITDLDNVRIRKISKVSTLAFIGGRKQNMTVCENNANTIINLLLSITDYTTGLSDTWTLIDPPRNGFLAATYSATSTGGRQMPAGLYYTPVTGFVGYDTFTVTVNNGLYADTTTIFVKTISAPSAGTLAGDSNLCVRSSLTLTPSIGGGVWSTSNIRAIVYAGVVTAATAGIDTIIYTVTNTCGTDAVAKAINIHALPEAGFITGASAFCDGSSVLLHASKPGGTWSSSNILAAIEPSGIVTGVSPGKVVIRYTVSDSFCSAIATHNITIDTFPNAGVISGQQHICLGSTITLSDNAFGGTWATRSICTSISHDGMVQGVNVGYDTISYSVSNSCGIATSLKPVTINPLPLPPHISKLQDTCNIAAGYASYQWAVEGILIPGATSKTYNLPAAGNYSVIVTNTHGCSAISQPIAFAGCSINDINIFPNPTSSLVYIQWCDKTTLRLTTADGKELGTSGQTNWIDLKDLPDAIYMINVYDADGIKIKTQRITKLGQ